VSTSDAQDDAGPGSVRWIGVADAAALRQMAYRHILDAAARAIQRRGRFLIVPAGGNTPSGIYRMLCTADTDWSRWQVYFGDERCLPADDAERNSRMAADAWLNRVPITQDQVHAIPAELGASAAALAYGEMLRGVGDFDLVLLGLGEDGHTASLFPGRDWGVVASAPDALAVFDAPKPPPQRVSLSAARLSRTREVLFMVEGEAKRDAVAQWRVGADIPARAIRPQAGVDVIVESQLLSAAGV
jgi:6-phosphogluconolactonase